VTLEIRVDPFPEREEFSALWRSGWGSDWKGPLPNWKISLVHLGAYDGGRLVGYVNVATDGSGHAFLLDPTVHKDWRRRGLGTTLVRRATELSRERGGQWLHVDYEPHLAAFYAACGFRPTQAGLIRLRG
jgi:ribosomal protein S18 acetylase RimI-like enzyme